MTEEIMRIVPDGGASCTPEGLLRLGDLQTRCAALLTGTEDEHQVDQVRKTRGRRVQSFFVFFRLSCFVRVIEMI